jgi:hypothetical protein
MRCHGRTPREPWNYGDAAVANYKYYAWVRENLLEYIYNSAVDSHETGVPMMRSLAVAYPYESSLATVNDEYMFGTDLLVAPVMDENNSRIIRFPSGQWTSLWSGSTVSGPATINLEVPLNTIPVYLRSGAIVPVQLNPSLSFGGSMSHGRVNALILTPGNEIRTRSLLNDQGHDAAVTMQPIEGGFAVTLPNLPETNYLLIYDANVSAVEAGDEILPKLEAPGFDLKSGGWYAEPDMNRMVVQLPAGDIGRATKLREINIKF